MEQKKPLARKQTFVHTPFSHSTLNIRLRKFHASKLLAFFLKKSSRDLPLKIMKMCEQFLKKYSAPIQFKFFEF